jgi:predicted membrane channel-forming protein YqfA (hemolysin III family)
VIAWVPPALFLVSWVAAVLGWAAPGADGSTPFDENALRWMLFLGMGWNILGGAVTHTIFAKDTAKAIGWQTNGFQYEVGFASLGIGLAGIYASNSDDPSAWIVAALAGGIFLFLAGINHVREIIADRNYAPGNTAILISDFGVPISLLLLLFATNAI